MEDSQEEFDYEVASDHVILEKVVDPNVLVDDSKLVNVVVPIYLSDSLFEQETIDSNIEKTPIDSPLQIHKTKILSEIYE